MLLFSIGSIHTYFGASGKLGAVKSDFRDIAQEFINLQNKHPEEDYEVDHIIPISQGGCNCPENIQVLTIEQHTAKTKAEFRMPSGSA